MEIHIFCTYQGKCIEFYVSLCRDLVVQLADRTTAQIPWIFILCIHVINFFIDPLKIFVTDHRFPSQDQFSFIRNMKRHVFKYFRIVGNDLTDFPISSCNCLKKFAVDRSKRSSDHPSSSPTVNEIGRASCRERVC